MNDSNRSDASIEDFLQPEPDSDTLIEASPNLLPKAFSQERPHQLHRIVLLVSTSFKSFISPPNILLLPAKATNEDLLEYSIELAENKQTLHPASGKETSVGSLAKLYGSRVMAGGFGDNNKKVDLRKMKQHWSSKLSPRSDSSHSLMLVVYELLSEADQSLKIKS